MGQGSNWVGVSKAVKVGGREKKDRDKIHALLFVLTSFQMCFVSEYMFMY